MNDINNGLGRPTAVERDGLGRPTTVERDGLGRPTAVERDGLGRPTSAEGPQAGARRQRFLLPPSIDERYVYEREIAVAGQSAVLLCLSRDTGEPVAVKLYHGEGVVDARVLDRLAGGDARHVVPSTFEHGDGEQWEIMEFFPLGSLRGILDEREREPFSSAFTRSFLIDMTDALVYLHGREVVHRDLKPDNVYVRAVDPLDVVIGDFGISIQSANTIAATVRATWAYAAPEASSATVTQAGDWWALGMMLFELLTGRHLMADPATGILPANDYEIRSRVGRGDFDLDVIGDKRWRTLLQGLLTVDSDHRWRESQVTSWLKGEMPTVHRGTASAPAAPTATRAGIRPFVIAERGYTDPVELAGAMVEHWQEAAERLAGRGIQELRVFLKSAGFSDGDVSNIVDRGSPSLVVLAMQRAFRPRDVPKFQGRNLDSDGLEGVARAAIAGNAQAAGWIWDARHLMLLSELARYVDDRDRERFAVAGDRLDLWGREAGHWREQMERQDDIHPVAADLSRRQEGMLLLCALDEGAARDLRARAIAQSKEQGPLPHWARPLVEACSELAPTAAAGTGIAVVADQVLPAARRLETDRVRAADDAERARDAAEKQAERERLQAARDTARLERRGVLGSAFATRLWAVAAVAVLAGISVAVPMTGWPSAFDWELALRGAAVGGGGVLIVSLLVFLWELFGGYVRLAARGTLLASALIVSLVLWASHTFVGLVPHTPTELSWWFTPSIVLALFFLLAAVLSRLTAVRLSEHERTVTWNTNPWRRPASGRRTETLAGWSLPVVVLAGIVAVGHGIGAVSRGTGMSVQAIVTTGAPFPWISDLAHNLDNALPDLGVPTGSSGLAAAVGIFCTLLVMQRLHRDLSAVSPTLAVWALVAALFLGLWLVLGSPWELVASTTFAVVGVISLVVGGLIVWVVLSMFS